MFNNIWNALSSNIWPFTIAILNLWAIFKVGGFIISVVIESFVKTYKNMHPWRESSLRWLAKEKVITSPDFNPINWIASSEGDYLDWNNTSTNHNTTFSRCYQAIASARGARSERLQNSTVLILFTN